MILTCSIETAQLIMRQLPPDAHMPTAGLRYDALAGEFHVPPAWEAAVAAVNTPGALSAENKRLLCNYAAGKRRETIDGGCTVQAGAAQIATWSDAATQGALTALVVAAGLNPALSTSWKGRDGVFHAITGPAIVDLATGVMAFVQSAFEIEAAASAAIATGTITTTAHIDALAWPQNS